MTHITRTTIIAAFLLSCFFCVTTRAELPPERTREAQALIKQFSAPEPAARQRAAEKLGAMSPDVVPLIQRTFATTTDNEVKRHCRIALKAIVKKHGADAVLVRALWHARVSMMAVGSGETAGEGLLAVVQEAPTVSYTHLRAHETLRYLVCRLLLEKKKGRPQGGSTL